MGFVLSKLFWLFFSPGNLLVLLLLITGFLVHARHPGWQDFGRKLCFNLAFLLFFLAIFPVGDWLLAPLENRFPASKLEKVDGILLLGGDEKPALSEVRGQSVALKSSSRYIEFAALARQYPDARLVFAGGSGRLRPDAQMKDAEVAKQSLQKIGVPVERMVFEDQSRNTIENAVNAAAIVKPEVQQNWLLVTSAVHMPRAMAVFRKAGWNVFAAPSDYHTGGQFSSRLEFNLEDHLMKTNMAMREYYGLLAYRLMGYTDSLWPK